MQSKYLKKIKQAIAEIEKSNAECAEKRIHHCNNIISCGANGRDLAKHIELLKEVHQMEFQNRIRMSELNNLLE